MLSKEDEEEDTIAHILHATLSHLEKMGSYVSLQTTVQHLHHSSFQIGHKAQGHGPKHLNVHVDTPHPPSSSTLEHPKPVFEAPCCTPYTHCIA